MNDSRKTDIGGIDKLSFELMLGENCLKGVSFEVISQHIIMYKMFMRWAKESHNKLLIRNEIFDHLTPFDLIKNIQNVNIDEIIRSDKVKELMDNCNTSPTQTKWLFAVAFINFRSLKGDGLLPLFNSWVEFVKLAKKLNRI